MLFKSVKTQFLWGIKQRGFILTFAFIFLLVLFNYIWNVLEFQGMDILEMFHPAKMILLSYNKTYYNIDMALFFVQLYPILVVCPAAFSIAGEKAAKEHILIISRVGSMTYYFSRWISTFGLTAVVFTVPFLLELILNILAFPLAAAGDFSQWNIYDSQYMDMASHYFFSDLYINNIYIYTIAGILFFGLISGLLGALTAGVSAVFRIKYRITLFLPVFLLLNFTIYLPSLLKELGIIENIKYVTGWYNYLLLFDGEYKNTPVFAGIVLLLLIISLSCMFFAGKEDCI